MIYNLLTIAVFIIVLLCVLTLLRSIFVDGDKSGANVGIWRTTRSNAFLALLALVSGVSSIGAAFHAKGLAEQGESLVHEIRVREGITSEGIYETLLSIVGGVSEQKSDEALKDIRDKASAALMTLSMANAWSEKSLLWAMLSLLFSTLTSVRVLSAAPPRRRM